MSHYVGASAQFRLSQKGLRKDGVVSLERELQFLRPRSRWLVRNDGYATAAMMKSASNWVGAGIIGKWDNEALQKHWAAFIKKPMLDGVGTFANFELLMAHSVFQSGELFTRIHYSAPKQERLPFSLEPIESDYCPVGASLQSFGEVQDGISYWKGTLAPKTYRFYNQNPNSESMLDDAKLVSVPAERIVHTFEATRPKQRRGFPFLAPAILSLWELQDLTDATIMRQKAAQAVGWIVEKQAEIAQFTPLGPISDVMPVPSINSLSSLTETKKAPKQIETITPGGVHYLQQGEKINFADPSDIGGNLVVLLKHELRKLSASMGLLYEQLTGDLTQVNYSSIRAGLVDFYTRVEQVQQLLLISKGLQPIADKFQAFASTWDGVDYSDAKITWIPPKKLAIDQLKDVKADKEELTGDIPIATVTEKLAERGKDYDEHMIQLDKELDDRIKRAKKLRQIEELENVSETTTKTGATTSNSGGESGDSIESDTAESSGGETSK